MMTLAELVQAYKTDPHLQPMSIDNDCVYVIRVNEQTDPDWLHAETIYDQHPEDLLEQALDLLGIPHEHI